jgi:hypothetical protein
MHKIGRDEEARSLFASIKSSDQYEHPFYKFQEKALLDWGFGYLVN